MPCVKCWWKSKTLWFNAAVAALTALEASFSLLQPVLGDKAYPVLLTVLTVGNAALRVITTQPIGKKNV